MWGQKFKKIQIWGQTKIWGQVKIGGYEWDQANSETRPRHVLEYAFTKNVCECQKNHPQKTNMQTPHFSFHTHLIYHSWLSSLFVVSIF